jgi:hypothetical protein
VGGDRGREEEMEGCGRRLRREEEMEGGDRGKGEEIEGERRRWREMGGDGM